MKGSNILLSLIMHGLRRDFVEITKEHWASTNIREEEFAMISFVYKFKGIKYVVI